MLGHLGMHPDHLIPRTTYLKNEIPIAGVAHQAGTVRFGTDPATSALDPNCKAHELDNLYVVDTSFFPSIGAVNPALTAIANALRVGDHLLERLGVAGGRPARARGRGRRRRRLAARHRRCPSMASRPEIAAVYGAGLDPGRGAGHASRPPARSSTSPSEYALTSTAYGVAVPAPGGRGDLGGAGRGAAHAAGSASSGCSWRASSATSRR